MSLFYKNKNDDIHRTRDGGEFWMSCWFSHVGICVWHSSFPARHFGANA
jgi:hypothetical protein